MRAVYVEEEAVAVLPVVAVAPDVVAALDDEAAPPDGTHALGKDQSREAGSDDQVVIAFAHSLMP
jgi:hypothetical protein